MINFLLHFAGHWSAPVIALAIIAVLCWAFPVVALANRGAVIVAIIAIGLYSGGLILGRKAKGEAQAAALDKARTELALAKSETAAALADRAAVIQAAENSAAIQAASAAATEKANAARFALLARGQAAIYADHSQKTCEEVSQERGHYMAVPLKIVVD